VELNDLCTHSSLTALNKTLNTNQY